MAKMKQQYILNVPDHHFGFAHVYLQSKVFCMSCNSIDLLLQLFFRAGD